MTITSGGIVRDQRVHISRPQDWGEGVGTDFWANWGNLLMADAASLDLVANGWVTTGFSHTVGSLAGMLDASDAGTTGGINCDTADDFIGSPFIFGDLAHGRMVESITGILPTTLTMECYARFASSAADEQATGFGFVEAGSTGSFAKADTNGLVTIGATNFELHTGADADEGSAKATTPSVFRVVYTSGSTSEWFIDGTSQGTLAIQANTWPAAFVINTQASGANDPVVAWTHIWYE